MRVHGLIHLATTAPHLFILFSFLLYFVDGYFFEALTIDDTNVSLSLLYQQISAFISQYCNHEEIQQTSLQNVFTLTVKLVLK